MADSWWTCPKIQRSYTEFSFAAARELNRMALDPEAARVSGLTSLTGSKFLHVLPAANASGEVAS